MAGLISIFASILFSNPQKQKLSLEEKFFFNVVGYPDIKKLLSKSIVSKEPIHILLTGPPSSSKTVFLLEMLDSLEDTYYVDAVGASGPGLMQHLFRNDTKYLLIDEIDKMKKSDQAVLLNVMETGILSETKLKNKTRQKKMKLWIFATSNDVERLSGPLRSRFMELHLDEYILEEFIEIARRLLKKQYQLDTAISEKIGYSVWNKMKSKDIRDVIKIAKLVKTSSDVDWLIEVQNKYRKKNSRMT
ncbi:MAG: AAA family ATPase [Thaumarchaeota archaeon]|nr:MAG: AAA family ATPase [Nitrososphaerota archaeon]TLX89951.1 MAG: AAA family ATPase [Nitrososphaerota archaeon]